MKLAFVADVHIGNHQYSGGALTAGVNERCESTLRVFSSALSRAHSMGCEQLIVLGDLFDSVRPNPQTLTRVRALLEAANFNTTLLIGNHDRNSSVAGDHALGPLGRTDRERGPEISVIETPYIADYGRAYCVNLPFLDTPVTEWFEPLIEKLVTFAGTGKSPLPILAAFVHFGLYDATLAAKTPWVRAAKDAADVAWVAAILKKYGIKHLFAGNWHTFQRWEIDGVHLTQVGALVPTGFDNSGGLGYGGLVVFDTLSEQYTFVELPGPRFFKIRSLAEWGDLCLDISLSSESLPEVHISWTCQPDEMSTALAALRTAHVPWLKSYRVLPDAKAASSFLRHTANIARQSDTVAELTAKFMSDYCLPEDCRRVVVQAHVLRFLGGSL